MPFIGALFLKYKSWLIGGASIATVLALAIMGLTISHKNNVIDEKINELVAQKKLTKDANDSAKANAEAARNNANEAQKIKQLLEFQQQEINKLHEDQLHSLKYHQDIREDILKNNSKELCSPSVDIVNVFDRLRAKNK